jgi:hypothetical protein
MKLISHSDPSFAEKWQMLWSEDKMQHPLAAGWDIPYQQEYYKNFATLEDVSFIIESESGPVLGLRAFIEKSETSVRLSAAGRPLVYLESQKRAYQIGSAFSDLKNQFLKIIDVFPKIRVIYTDYLTNASISKFSLFLLELGGTPHPYFTQIINLRLDEKDLWADTRVSYRSLINWGMREMQPQVFDKSNIELTHIHKLRDLHIKAAGRSTRSDKTWDLQFEWVKSGHAFLVLGHLGEVCVSGALFLTTNKCAYYGVSASDRDMANKSLAHAVLWKGVLHAKSIDCETIETGAQIFTDEQETYLTEQIPTSRSTDHGPGNLKHRNISMFKRGFGGMPHNWLEITYTSSPKVQSVRS